MIFILEIPIKLLDPTNDGVVANVFPNAFLLRWPDCTLYGNRSAGLVYTELPTNDNSMHNFHPECGSRVVV